MNPVIIWAVSCAVFIAVFVLLVLMGASKCEQEFEKNQQKEIEGMSNEGERK